jgi:hypothetical protein
MAMTVSCGDADGVATATGSGAATAAAGFSISAGTGALAGKRAFVAAGFGTAAADLPGGAGFFAAASDAAGFAVAVLAAPARLGLTRFFAATGAASGRLVSSSGRTTGGWLSPKGDVTALRALAADAFIANLVAPETSMNEHGLVNQDKQCQSAKSFQPPP